MPRFSVFGAAGYIGRHICQHLESLGNQVLKIIRGDWPAEESSLGHVIYAIGVTSDVRTKPIEAAEAHVGLLARVLGRYNFDSFLYLSSTAVYLGVPNGQEDAAIAIRPSDPTQLYKLTKLTGESLCLSLPQPTVRVVRLSSVIGPGAPTAYLLPNVIEEAKRTGRVTLRTAPDSSRDYIDVEDAVRLLRDITLKGQKRFYNVASGVAISNATLADLLHRTSGTAVNFLPAAPVIAYPLIDITRISREFDFVPTPFATSLNRMIVP